MLTIRNLEVEYKKDSLILKGISLSMEPGKIHGLVGLNGAGKTTLLNTLYGFIRPAKVISFTMTVLCKDGTLLIWRQKTISTLI